MVMQLVAAMPALQCSLYASPPGFGYGSQDAPTTTTQLWQWILDPFRFHFNFLIGVG